MGEQDDRAFGEAAVERGLVTKEQLTEFRKLAAAVTQAGLKRSLADVLLEKGVLTEFQVELISRSLASAGEGRIIGGYEIVEKIGEGGMGAVYRAKQVSMDRVVALKLLPEQLAKDEKFAARFLREARMAAKLDHVNIVRGIDVGKDGDDYYFAMEFVEGESVGDLLKREGALSEERALSIIIQVARALQHAWESKLIHRDIKPDNILLAEGDVTKLADMGLARTTDTESTVMTRTGVAMGTPLYMSPEQARGDKGIDTRTDIYSLGATLYHMLAGEVPFSGTSAAAVITKHLTEPVIPVHERNPEVSARTSRIIQKMMQKEPGARYTGPAELLKDLELAIDGKEPTLAMTAAAAAPAPVQTLVESAGEIARAQAAMAQPAPKAGKWVIPAVVAFLLLVGGGAAAFFLTRGPGAEDLARAEGEAIKVLVKEGNLEKALGRAEGAAATYARTTFGPWFRDQADMIEAQLQQAKKHAAEKERMAEEKRKREAEESARREAARKAAEAALASARALAAEKKFAEGRKELGTSAEKIKTAGLEGEMNALLAEIARAEEAEAQAAAARAREERSRNLVSQADAAVEKRDFAGAVKLYDEALALKDDAEVQAKREAAQKGLGEERRLAELLKIIQSVDPQETADIAALERALVAAREAVKLAEKEEAKRLETLSRSLASSIEYRRSMAAATAAASREEWKTTREAARMALVARPGDAAAKALLAKAEEEFKPKPVEAVAEKPAKPIRTTRNRIGMELVWVPGGEFVMGSESGEPDEGPAHRVRLGGFWIGRTEVTNSQYELFDPGHRTGRGSYSTGDDCPAVRLSWSRAVAFCEWLSKYEGTRYRFPSEAEWEYAARGADGRAYPWGNNWGEKRANAKGSEDGHEGCSPVGSFPGGGSPFGLLDCAGNVWEWCLDWYGVDYYAASPRENPRGPLEGTQRVTRGGSWFNPADALRVTNRAPMDPRKANSTIGFRVVMEAGGMEE